MTAEGARIDVLLARNLGCARGAARALVQDGGLVVGGVPLTNPRQSIPAERLPLLAVVDGVERRLHDRVHVLLNKPLGCVTALRDPRHPTAYALLREAPLHAELRPVGRLDLDTTGLLLWTNDGSEIQRLTHPRRAVPRTYQAALARPFGPLPATLRLDDGHQPNVLGLGELPRDRAHPSLPVPPETALLASITIGGGAYHEVRRIFAALGSHVLGLCRVGFGRLALPPDLPLGGYRLIGGAAA
ncbi:MAG TPA: pseudouridine synthase [Polyangia bacterium]|nr:pseudouridine synthase [Polyangia bacterium]